MAYLLDDFRELAKALLVRMYKDAKGMGCWNEKIKTTQWDIKEARSFLRGDTHNDELDLKFWCLIAYGEGYSEIIMKYARQEFKKEDDPVCTPNKYTGTRESLKSLCRRKKKSYGNVLKKLKIYNMGIEEAIK